MIKKNCEVRTNEMRERNTEYSVGLDIGTTSVGWSVIDKHYKLFKRNGQNMWGSYLFEEGQTAAERRGYRSSRRRMNRRKRRISLLKMLMGEIVLEKDGNFFMKLEKSHVKKGDSNQKYNFFNDEYDEKEYYENFPTIYHLRDKLCNSKEKADPRLLYLAIHHIIKYRGNFLYEGQTFNVSDKKNSLEALKEIFSDITKMYFLEEVNDLEVNNVLEILTDTTISKKERLDKIINILINKFESKTKAKALGNLLLGYKCDLEKLFDERCVSSEGKPLILSFTSNKYEEEIALLESVSQDVVNIVLECNKIYSFIQLKDILDVDDSDKEKEPSLSASMIKKYNNHEEDLAALKKIIKKYFDNEVYTQVFKDKLIKGNYHNYINDKANTPQNDDNSFSKYIDKVLRSNAECLIDSDVVKVLDKINNKEFMPKQNTKDNGIIPYQLHKSELIKILNNQKLFYPILDDNFNEILSLLTFRIPYYIGPLSNIDDKFAWIVKKNNKDIIYPWNYEDVIDVEQSAENFIKRMTNQCSYLWDKEVLPKNSLIYSKYEVLNELNKIDVIKRDKSGSLKREVFQGLFMNTERVTEKKLRKFLMDSGYDNLGAIKGFQKEGEFASSLLPWIKFKKIFPTDFYEKMADIEKMIEWITVYEDKKILKKRLKSNFEYLCADEEKIKQICSLKFAGWGRLSKELLVDMKCKDEYEGSVSILDVLYNTNMNFMQIITDKRYKFKEKIELHNNDDDETNISKKIDEIPSSPSVKKGIRQSVKILEDIVKVMRCEPTNIFIEFAREDGVSKRTDSRLLQIAKKYEKIENKIEFKQVIKELNEKAKDKSSIKSKSLLLYFLQGAKCLYTGEQLDIDQLHLYQVDHILPQSYIKDDSIDNLALVKSAANQYKGDDLLIDSRVQESQKARWFQLRKTDLISEKKFMNLTRKVISPLEEMNFINRQLVETRQITKHVANIFKKTYTNTLIGSIKAELSSDFRRKFDIYKIRNLNDYHHAHDAYIASVIGTFVLKAYPNLKREFIFDEFVQLKDFKNKLREMQNKIKQNSQKSLYGFILNQMDINQLEDAETGEIIWDTEIKKTILEAFEYKDCHIVKKAEEKNGSMHDLTLKKPEKEDSSKIHKLIPRGGGFHDIYKYGGYTSIKPAYMVAVSYLAKNGIKKKLLNVPIIYKDNEKLLLEYLAAELKSEDVKIESKILMNQKIKIDNGYYYLASSSEWNNATQLLLSKKSKETIYTILKRKEVSREVFKQYLDEHLSKLKKYYPLYGGVHNNLIEKYDDILSLEKKERMQFVNQLLILTAANKANANFDISNLKLSKREGRLTGKNCNLSDCEFIFSSPTGMYTTKQKI